MQRLDLRLFVHAQDQRLVRRVEIQADDVSDFVNEQRVFRELECLTPMWLQPERAPDSAHRGLTESAAIATGWECTPRSRTSGIW